MPNKLVIADDNLDFLEFVETVAQRSGWDVTTCSDGKELLSSLEKVESSALVLVDINMPHLDGVEVARCLSEGDCTPPRRLRFITGGDPSSAKAAQLIARSRVQNLGETLFKPLSLSCLRDVLTLERSMLQDLS